MYRRTLPPLTPHLLHSEWKPSPCAWTGFPLTGWTKFTIFLISNTLLTSKYRESLIRK